VPATESRTATIVWTMAFSLSNLGRAAFAEADYRRASVHYQEAIEIRETLGDARGKALGLLYLGDATLAEGDPEAARKTWGGRGHRHVGACHDH